LSLREMSKNKETRTRAMSQLFVTKFRRSISVYLKD